MAGPCQLVNTWCATAISNITHTPSDSSQLVILQGVKNNELSKELCFHMFFWARGLPILNRVWRIQTADETSMLQHRNPIQVATPETHSSRWCHCPCQNSWISPQLQLKEPDIKENQRNMPQYASIKSKLQNHQDQISTTWSRSWFSKLWIQASESWDWPLHMT